MRRRWLQFDSDASMVSSVASKINLSASDPKEMAHELFQKIDVNGDGEAEHTQPRTTSRAIRRAAIAVGVWVAFVMFLVRPIAGLLDRSEIAALSLRLGKTLTPSEVRHAPCTVPARHGTHTAAHHRPRTEPSGAVVVCSSTRPCGKWTPTTPGKWTSLSSRTGGPPWVSR
jgi:hypothetical protein